MVENKKKTTGKMNANQINKVDWGNKPAELGVSADAQTDTEGGLLQPLLPNDQ